MRHDSKSFMTIKAFIDEKAEVYSASEQKPGPTLTYVASHDLYKALSMVLCAY